MTAASARRNSGSAEVGVFGGTFNPIHLGHLRAAEEAAEILGLDRVIFVPSADPPHKSGCDHLIAPARDRLAWVEAAIDTNDRFAVDALELDRNGRSYSVDTLEALGQRIAPQEPVFLIGDEAFLELGTWREPDRLLRLAHFAVLRRPLRPELRPKGGLAEWLPETLARDLEIASDGLTARHRDAGTWIRTVEIRGLDVSATDIRGRIRDGRSTRYLMPEATRERVEAAGHYGPQEAE